MYTVTLMSTYVERTTYEFVTINRVCDIVRDNACTEFVTTCVYSNTYVYSNTHEIENLFATMCVYSS